MRRRSLVSTLNRLSRDMERNQKAKIREMERQNRAQLQLERQQAKEAERLEKLAAKHLKEYYQESRRQETDSLNKESVATVQELESTLIASLGSTSRIEFESLYSSHVFPEFIEPELVSVPENPEPNRESFLDNVPKPSLLLKIFGKKRILDGNQQAEQDYQLALQEYHRGKMLCDEITQQNEETVARARQQYNIDKDQFEEQVRQHNEEVDQFHERYLAGDPEAVEGYNRLVLERSEYSELFPQEFVLHYTPQSKELVVEYELPPVNVIPQYKGYKYVQSRDEIKGTPFHQKEVGGIYSRLVCSVALRTINELFQADQGQMIDSVGFNGIVPSIDPATGRDIRPCIVTLHVTKDGFQQFDLARVDVVACVKGLKAHVSPALTELAPVKPIVDLNMYDKRFVNEKDMLSGVDDRTNLLEMDPFDFEHLICNLFSKIGLEAKLTRSSRDGGIDVVAFDPTPVFGGKYVIQAKRYKNVVEVSAVRDLYGSMMNENAAKGILVTTSTFGPDARGFAKDKPIELIDGHNLLHMLEEQGINAKIVVPSD